MLFCQLITLQAFKHFFKVHTRGSTSCCERGYRHKNQLVAEAAIMSQYFQAIKPRLRDELKPAL